MQYNNATLEYLNFQIEEERAKVWAGGSKRRLDVLTQDRDKYNEIIEALTCDTQSDSNWHPLTDDGVDQLLRQLYNLKH
jgi:hypothetical protein